MCSSSEHAHILHGMIVSPIMLKPHFFVLKFKIRTLCVLYQGPNHTSWLHDRIIITRRGLAV